ncbi:unnamed protein product [Closterium sp. Naga37s-1]|nr:unnamed protein product [Closterium sp. Naga37s-1]
MVLCCPRPPCSPPTAASASCSPHSPSLPLSASHPLTSPVTDLRAFPSPFTAGALASSVHGGGTTHHLSPTRFPPLLPSLHTAGPLAPWPVSAVVPPSALQGYNLSAVVPPSALHGYNRLFRFLLAARRTHLHLALAWSALQANLGPQYTLHSHSQLTRGLKVEGTMLQRVHWLRHRMACAVTAILDHVAYAKGGVWVCVHGFPSWLRHRMACAAIAMFGSVAHMPYLFPLIPMPSFSSSEPPSPPTNLK